MSRTVPHPDLHLARLELLPLRPRVRPSHRRVLGRNSRRYSSLRDAYAWAIAPADAVKAFKAILDELPPGSRETSHMFPALYFLMDPATIPPAEEVAELAPSAEAAMADGAAYLAFFLEKVGPAKTAPYTALWLRMLPWVDFFNTYGEFLAATPLRVTFVQLFLSLGADARITDLRGLRIPSIWENPRFSFLLGQALAAMFDSKTIVDGAIADEARSLIFRFIEARSPHGDINVENFLEGVGGAGQWALVLGHNLRKITRRWAGRSHVSPRAMTCIDAFVLAARTMLDVAERQADNSLDADFVDGLVDARYIAGLTTALGILALPRSDPTDDLEDLHQEMQNQALLLFRRLLGEDLSAVLLQSAVSNGLLSALVALARSVTDEFTEVEEEVTEILQDVLLPELLDPQIITALAKDMRDTKVEQSLPRVPSLEVRQLFVTLLTRVKVLEECLSLWAVRKVRDRRLCDAVGCTSNDKAEQRACSVCGFRRYCSVACQRADWTTGGHRAMCAAYREANTELQDCSTAPTRSFVRFLMAREYARDHPAPSRGPAVAVFDYRQQKTGSESEPGATGPRPFVSGADFTGLRDAAEILEGLVEPDVWADYCARATADAGFGVGWNICVVERQGDALVYVHRVLRAASSGPWESLRDA
ncbi:MYND-type domain-containing protein [Mycena indigotica]|uniref:MYND-type domain-containing protein n=1 Tax=Mycena indigotica TaxID=2126181 RepID=A0A8H6RXX4_9AGAR|nr:MYND-type domain-containing protein [Mycena indigotica]KAF7288966.1 MYND-type domain-containing protein [Mycena indigotica]